MPRTGRCDSVRPARLHKIFVRALKQDNPPSAGLGTHRISGPRTTPVMIPAKDPPCCPKIPSFPQAARVNFNLKIISNLGYSRRHAGLGTGICVDTKGLRRQPRAVAPGCCGQSETMAAPRATPAMIDIAGVSQTFATSGRRESSGAVGDFAVDRRRRLRLHSRAVRLRQVHAAVYRWRLRQADRRHREGRGTS